jgi:glycosyltransferase involved in cell wall biosynthesis
LKKLVIISHTEHQKTIDGNYVGWGPTVNEINFLSEHWEEVIHVACLEKNVKVRGSSVGYISDKIKFEPIPTFGGKKFWQKLDILWKMPLILHKVKKSLKGASHVQLRVPMGIGIFLIPFFALRNQSKYIFWVKYANNWDSKYVPLGYKIQRYLLKKNFLNCKVTINGIWPNQPKHCISFENPCLTNLHVEDGLKIIKQKKYSIPYEVIFVGRLDKEKGVDILIEFMEHIDKDLIVIFHIVGRGDLEIDLEKAMLTNGVNYKMHGSLNQSELFEILKWCFAIFLPSRSEGFPKVLAEAMNFGCIPISSSVGSISHHIKNLESGIIMSDISIGGLIAAWKNFQSLNFESKLTLAQNGFGVSQNFTFERYLNNLKNKVFNDY